MKKREKKIKKKQKKVVVSREQRKKISQKHRKESSNKSWSSNTQNIKETDPQDDTEVKIVLDQQQIIKSDTIYKQKNIKQII